MLQIKPKQQTLDQVSVNHILCCKNQQHKTVSSLLELTSNVGLATLSERKIFYFGMLTENHSIQQVKLECPTVTMQQERASMTQEQMRTRMLSG